MFNCLKAFFIVLIGILLSFPNNVSAKDNEINTKSFFEQALEKIEIIINSNLVAELPTVPSIAVVANCEPPENPGFENGVVDWSFGTNTSITTDAAVGTNAAQIGTAAGTIFSRVSDINVNSDYILSFQAKANTLSSDASVSLRWLDATGTDITSNTVSIPNTANYTEFSVASTSPSNATELLIFIEKQANGTLFIDEFCLTETAEISTFTSTDVPLTIVDNAASTITSTIVINEPGLTIEDLNLNLDISHTYVGDLDVTLISPAGTSILLYNNHCGDNDDIIFTVDDEASLLSCPPNDGNNHSVLTSLSDFDDEEISGTWTLQVYDYYAADGGTLNAWSLDIVTNNVNICNNGTDDDGDGLIDEYDPNCDCGEGRTYSIGSGAAVSVISEIGVGNPGEAAGNPDDNGAELYDNSDEIVLDLGFILKAGQPYSIFWHKKTSYGAGVAANMLVAESLSPSAGFVDNPVNPSTTERNSFIKSTLTTNIDTRYIKIKSLSGGGNDLVLDAIIYNDIVQCTQNEICDNAIDDDGDGDIDDDDSDCDCNSCYQPVVQEYHIPFPEDQVFSSLSTIFPGNSSNSNCNSGVPPPDKPINSYVSVSVFIDNSIIYFDHWEDDFEAQISNPTQATSQIWGDGNPFNGAPPGISSDILYAGTVIILDNTVDPDTRQTVFDYDGGDRFATSFPISITRSAWAAGSETLFAGALEVYPTSDWGTEYRFPAGENIDASFQYFEYVGAVVMAQVDGTVINIDKDNNGSFEQTLTLSKGQSQLVDGGILIGGRVTSSEPVQVNMITGDICDNYESRWLTIPPIANWSNDYISPVYGSTQKYYIYNPNTSAMTVEVESTTDSDFSSINIPAGGTASFLATETSGYRLSNNGGANFYAYVLHDAANASSSENSTWDWGAALLPLNKLSQQVITGWAPGQDPTKSETENGSPVWVTAAYPASSSSTGPITICIDYDGNGQGAFTDSFGRQYDVSETLDVLESYQAFDPDGDQTSMLIYICNSTSDAVLSAIWGQDSASASVGSPGLDVGTGIPGLNPYFAYKTITLIGDIDNNGEYNVGDTIQYAIGLANFGFVPISGNFSVSDVLPSEFNYLANSTRIVSAAGTSSVADAGVSPFPLDEGGIVTFLSLNPGEEAQIQFNGVISAVPAGNLLKNVATTIKDNITYTPEVIVEVDVVDEICENGIDDDLDGLIDCDCLSEGNIITGNVWVDEDENQVNNNETGVENIQINIYLDENGNGDIDAGDNIISTTTSDANGNYSVEVSGGIATSRVSADNDDGEEHRGFFFQGAMTRNRDDLRLGNAGSQIFSPTLVGTRFRNLDIPQGATITNAYIEFTADESFGGAGNLTILGEDIDDAPGLGNGYNNISSRTATDAIVTWTDVPSWFSEQVYETPNLSSIVQEIVNRSGWSSGNDMLFAYFGDARRSAYSYNGDDDKAPRLVVQYSIYPSNYIVEIDNGSMLAYSAGASLTTPDQTDIQFNAKDEYSCDNSFGLKVVEICGNNTDDDFDGDTDCDDTDCGVDITVNNNGPVCAGAVVQLSGLVDTDYSGTTTYSWVGPNGFTSTEQNPTRVNATIAMAGTYTFTATNDNGCSSSSNTVVVIQADCSGICDQVIQVTPTDPTECFLDNGSIFVTEYGASFYQNSIDGTNWFESEHTYSNLTVGNYNIFLRDKVTGITCRTVNINLTVQDETIYTGENVSSASSCFTADGSIQLLGVDGTDRVSWISSTNPSYVLISTLSPTNTITGLVPGTYYVRLVRGNNDYCYSERIVEVPNNGEPCNDELCVGNARVNLFPDGDFGTGVSVNGSPLEIGATSYGYTPMTCNSPNDGQYSIINTTDCNGSGGAIYNAFVVTEDHTPGDINGYMMLVNASFNPDIALERTVTGLCENTEYEFSLWVNNVQTQAPIKPNLTFLINGVGLHNTGDITAGGWQKVGFTFFTGTNTTSTFSIRNNAPGGWGNDWAIDDVFVGICQPEIIAEAPADRCEGAINQTLEFTVNDVSEQYIHYSFEESTDGGNTWTTYSTPQIGSFVAGAFTATLDLASPITTSLNNRQYRIKLATSLSNLSNGCELTDNFTTLNVITCDEVCADGIDNDGDGLIDCDDQDAWDECCIPSQWNFDCDDNTCVELQGVGIKSNVPTTMTFSDVSSIQYIVIQATYDGGNGHPNTVNFAGSDGNAYDVPKTLFDGGDDYYYEAYFGPVSSITLTHPNGTNASRAESYIAYVFRDCVNQASVGSFTHRKLSQGEDFTFTLSIPTAPAPRDIEIAVPISELTNNGNNAYISAVGGSVSKTITINTYNQGNSLNITPFILEEVPGDVTTVEVTVSSPVGGQSLYLSGAGSASVDCPIIDLQKTANTECAEVGETITYTYVVTNVGDSNLTNINLIDDKLGNITLPNTSLTPGNSMTVTATHTVAAIDLPGPIVNIATATGVQTSTGETVNDDATESVGLSDISIVKTANPTTALPGDEITYTYEITNNGSEFLFLNLTDDKLGNIDLTEDLQVPGLIAFYDFLETSGSTINDNSNYGSPLNLTIENPANITWNGDNISVNSGTRARNTTDSNKVWDSISQGGTGGNQFSVETWVQPANNTQDGPARMFALTGSTGAHNFILGQEGDEYEFRLRTTDDLRNSVTTTGDIISSSPTLQHVVFTYDGTEIKAYINGVETSISGDVNPTGDFSNWDASHDLVLFNETTESRDWLGGMHLAGVYNRALSDTEVSTMYNIGAQSLVGTLLAGQTATITETYTIQESDLPNTLTNVATVTGTSANCNTTATDDADVDFCRPVITDVDISNCSANSGAVESELSITVEWGAGATTGDITVSIPGQSTIIDSNGSASSPTTVSFTIVADASVNNTITVTHPGAGCSTTATYDAPSTCGENAGDCPGPTVNAGPNITVCEGETVNLSATATQGDYNFIYSWDNGLGIGQTHSFVGTASGTANSVTDYTVTATDGNGCKTTDIVRVTVLSNPVVSVTNSDEYCGQDNGTITFTFTNHTGRTGIEFSIDNGTSYPYSANDNAGSFTTPGLSAGNYQLSARWGDNSCPVDLGSVTLSDAAPPTVLASVNDNDICEGETISLTAAGTNGTGTLTYAWSNSAGSSSSVNVSPTTTTTYTVTVTDGEGCTDTDQVLVNVTNNFDNGGTIGSDESNCDSFNPANITNITPPAAGANGTIEYFWERRESNGAGGWTSWLTISGETNLTYDPSTISITTQYRRSARRLPCTEWQVSNIVTKTVNELPVVNAGTDINICAGETVNLSATASGGDGNYTYTWDNSLGGGASHSFTASATNLANSIIDYTVTVTDGNGCVDTDIVRVQVYSLPSVTVTSEPSNCGQSNANITLNFLDNSNRTGIEFSIDGGTTYPYSTNDNTGSITIEDLLAGSYSIYARWGNSQCPINVGVEVIGDLDGPSVLTGNDQTVCAGESVTITATGSGGTGGLNYSWDNGLGTGASHTFTPPALPSGNLTTTYTVTTTDAEGCSAVASVNVTVESQPSITVNKSDEHCDQKDGYIVVSFDDNTDQSQIEFSIDGGANYPYTIQDVNGSFVIGNLSAGTYDLWARWGGGNCPISVQPVTLNNLAGITVLAAPDKDICLGEGTVITADASGGTFPYLYTWDNGLGNGQSKTVYPTVTTTYSVTATDNFGCTDVDEIVVTVLPLTDPLCSRCTDIADVDNDGVCASEDCDDNDPNLPAEVGSTCDDSNAFTINDEIQQDSCTCLGNYIPCSTNLDVVLQQPTYNDNGTPANLSDDTFTFDVTISGNGNAWMANGQTGTYGQTVTFGPYTVDAAGITFEVLDQDNPNCRENISVNISSCIYSGVCTCCN